MMFLGDRVTPTANKTIHGGMAMWGWREGVGRIAEFGEDRIRVRLPLRLVPPGWKYTGDYDPKTMTVVVTTDYGDLRKVASVSEVPDEMIEAVQELLRPFAPNRDKAEEIVCAVLSVAPPEYLVEIASEGLRGMKGG